MNSVIEAFEDYCHPFEYSKPWMKEGWEDFVNETYNHYNKQKHLDFKFDNDRLNNYYDQCYNELKLYHNVDVHKHYKLKKNIRIAKFKFDGEWYRTKFWTKRERDKYSFFMYFDIF